MPDPIPTYVQGASMADLEVTWTDKNGAVIPFGTGWTFEVRIGRIEPPDVQLAKVNNIVGADAAPNVLVQWQSTDLDDVEAGVWDIQIIATRNSDGRKRILNKRNSFQVVRLIPAV